MELHLHRKWTSPHATIGELLINDEAHPICLILEDTVREHAEGGGKIKGQTAIPAGRYEVVMTYSQRFGRLLPLLLNVPNFSGIRIHSGNTAADTEGCLLAGNIRSRLNDEVTDSRLALARLLTQLGPAWGREKVFITITNDFKEKP